MGLSGPCYDPSLVSHYTLPMRKLAFVALMLISAASAAEGVPPVAQQEINHLFAYLKASGCQFSRNGSWYTPQEAVDHLNDKYQYLIHHDMVNTAEDFIEYAATKSSWSGKAYEVKCGSAAAEETSGWFRAELQKYRRTAATVSSRR
jgi:Family of unknown function (DUF5329)